MSFSDKRVGCSHYLSENINTISLIGCLTVFPLCRLHGNCEGIFPLFVKRKKE